MQENKEVPTKEEFEVIDTMHSIGADISVLMAKLRNLPKSRERAIVNTKLEEAMLYSRLDIERNLKE